MTSKLGLYIWPVRSHAKRCENAHDSNKSMYHKDNYSNLFPGWAGRSYLQIQASPLLSTSSNIYVIYRVFAAPVISVKVFYDNDV